MRHQEEHQLGVEQRLVTSIGRSYCYLWAPQLIYRRLFPEVLQCGVIVIVGSTGCSNSTPLHAVPVERHSAPRLHRMMTLDRMFLDMIGSLLSWNGRCFDITHQSESPAPATAARWREQEAARRRLVKASVASSRQLDELGIGQRGVKIMAGHCYIA